MRSILANPLSRRNLREFANSIRQYTSMENNLYFPIVEFIELILPHIFTGFNFEVCSMSELKNVHGLTCREENFIKIREDVYLGAINGEGRDRLTCAHELGHYFLHSSSSVQLARVAPGQIIKPFLDPEWQASAFAGELLMPAHLIRGMSVNDICRNCGVSEAAAEKQLRSL